MGFFPLRPLPRAVLGATLRAASNLPIPALLAATADSLGRCGGGPSRQTMVWGRWLPGMAAQAAGVAAGVSSMAKQSGRSPGVGVAVVVATGGAPCRRRRCRGMGRIGQNPRSVLSIGGPNKILKPRKISLVCYFFIKYM
jgi:hypothetical protein